MPLDTEISYCLLPIVTVSTALIDTQVIKFITMLASNYDLLSMKWLKRGGSNIHWTLPLTVCEKVSEYILTTHICQSDVYCSDSTPFSEYVVCSFAKETKYYRCHRLGNQWEIFRFIYLDMDPDNFTVTVYSIKARRFQRWSCHFSFTNGTWSHRISQNKLY